MSSFVASREHICTLLSGVCVSRRPDTFSLSCIGHRWEGILLVEIGDPSAARECLAVALPLARGHCAKREAWCGMASLDVLHHEVERLQSARYEHSAAQPELISSLEELQRNDSPSGICQSGICYCLLSLARNAMQIGYLGQAFRYSQECLCAARKRTTGNGCERIAQASVFASSPPPGQNHLGQHSKLSHLIDVWCAALVGHGL